MLKKESRQGELGEGFENASPWEGMKDVLILGLGSAMVLAVAVVIQLAFAYVNYPFFEQSFLFVVPLGAGFCGLVAGGGFWFALRKLDRLPTKFTYAVAFLMGLVGYLFIYYLIWLDTEIPGGKLKDVMSYPEFLQTWILNQRMKVGRFGMGGKAIELGKLGYGKFALNILGFAFGSVISVSIAGGRAYCPTCRRYYRPHRRRSRTSSRGLRDYERATPGSDRPAFPALSGTGCRLSDHHHQG